MSETTKIEWADATFNPWIGCTKVSPGCAWCYAENTTRARVLRSQGHETWGKGAKRSRTSLATWRNPVKWNREFGEWRDQPCAPHLRAAVDEHAKRIRPRIFPSLCDWLDDEVPIEWLADFLKLISDTPHLDWLLLTKRPENWRDRICSAMVNLDAGIPRATTEEAAAAMKAGGETFKAFIAKYKRTPAGLWLADWLEGNPPSNVWVGASAEDQKRADERIPELLKIPAKVRFLSVEPLLGPVEFSDVTRRSDAIQQLGKPALSGIDWVICGGESGSGARHCNVEWVRNIVNQCKAAEVPVFVKQLGARPITGASSIALHLKDNKGGNMEEWAEDLRVRQFPSL